MTDNRFFFCGSLSLESCLLPLLSLGFSFSVSSDLVVSLVTCARIYSISFFTLSSALIILTDGLVDAVLLLSVSFRRSLNRSSSFAVKSSDF